jgi:hypothetical protein
MFELNDTELDMVSGGVSAVAAGASTSTDTAGAIAATAGGVNSLTITRVGGGVAIQAIFTGAGAAVGLTAP